MLGHVLPPLLIIAVTVLFAWLLRRVIDSRAVRARVPAEMLEGIDGLRAPVLTLIFLVMLRAYQAVLESVLHIGHWMGVLLNVLVMLALGWVVVRLSAVLVAVLQMRLERRFVEDPQRLRRIHTQLTVFRGVIAAVIWLATAILIMLTFPATRPIATSLFASASLLSLVIGIAAQGTLGSLFAGLQIAFGDIVRIGDMVVVDGQRGVVEEIALTYVVVRLLDYRRMVVPVTFFVTKSFENWTRKHPGVKADTYVNVDFATPVDLVRERVGRIIEGSELWDRDEWSLVVAEPGPDAHQLRLHIAATAESPGNAAELCAQVREQLQAYLVNELPEALPRMRLADTGSARGTGERLP